MAEEQQSKGMFGTVTSGLGNVGSGVTNTVGKGVGGVTNTLGDTVSGVGKGLGDTVGGVTKGLGDTTKGQIIDKMVVAAGGMVTNTTDKAGESMGGKKADVGGKKSDEENHLGL